MDWNLESRIQFHAGFVQYEYVELAYPDVSKEDTEPDFIGEWAHEAENVGFHFCGFVDL